MAGPIDNPTDSQDFSMVMIMILGSDKLIDDFHKCGRSKRVVAN